MGMLYRYFQALKRLRMAHNGQVRLLERVANLLMLGGYDPNKAKKN